MIPIKYVIGDASLPESLDGERVIIAHICNDIGAWGAGFVMALTKRCPNPELQYRMWADFSNPTIKFKLGNLTLANYYGDEIEDGTIVANMIAQHRTNGEFVLDKVSRRWVALPPLRYSALATCLIKLRAIARSENASVHMPRIGCGLAGGTWDKVVIAVEGLLSRHDIPVVVYDLTAPAPVQDSAVELKMKKYDEAM